mmetsp:Transcript_30833/g.50929  ORF Transcript_30833/g.50929 Transcript_30833/m.50929 type:complete len:89 (-) Transcript_30833:166-432(-)
MHDFLVFSARRSSLPYRRDNEIGGHYEQCEVADDVTTARNEAQDISVYLVFMSSQCFLWILKNWTWLPDRPYERQEWRPSSVATVPPL